MIRFSTMALGKMTTDAILFRPNYSSPFAPPQLVNVSLETYQNIYTYDRVTLWIAYGLSLFLTTLAVIAGMKVSTFSTLFSRLFVFLRAVSKPTETIPRFGDPRASISSWKQEPRRRIAESKIRLDYTLEWCILQQQLLHRFSRQSNSGPGRRCLKPRRSRSGSPSYLPPESPSEYA